MAGNRITIQFEGDPAEGGHVRLSIFIKKLEALKKALNKTERLITQSDEITVTYRIVNASHSSPLTCTLEAVPRPETSRTIGRRLKPSKDYSTANVARLLRTLTAIKKRKDVFEMTDTGTLEAYQELTDDEGGLANNIKIINGSTHVDVDTEFSKNLAEYLGSEEVVYGSVTGRIEYVNVHDERKFFIYPTDGSHRISGEFKKELREQVYDSIEKYVRIYGLVHYKYNETTPYKVKVEGIEPLKTEEEMPPVNSLKGTVRKDAFSTPSEDIIKEERNANW